MSLASSIRFLLYVALVSLIVEELTEARSLRHRHGHYLHLNHNDREESLPRQLSLHHLERENLDLQPHNVLELRSNIHRSSTRDFNRLLGLETRRKRHGIHGGVTYRQTSQEDRQEHKRYRRLNNERNSVRNNHHNKKYDDYYELEVKEAQNSSICNYTVVSIPDTKGSRIPRDLEHVICNHVGSSCQSAGTYCCIQTYRNIEVKYADNTSEIMKVYAGCICALQMYPELADPEATLPIND